MAGIPIGGGDGPLERRIASIERFIRGKDMQRFKAVSESGVTMVYEAIASTGTPAGESLIPTHPFQITVSSKNNQPKFKVFKGSVTDGTNGEAMDLGKIFEQDHTASAGFVVLNAKVAADFKLSDWAIKVVAAEQAKEVLINEATPPVQTEIRLLIGKITMEKGIPKAWQASFSSVRAIYGVLNGVLVKVFEEAPTHADKV